MTDSIELISCDFILRVINIKINESFAYYKYDEGWLKKTLLIKWALSDWQRNFILSNLNLWFNRKNKRQTNECLNTQV